MIRRKLLFVMENLYPVVGGAEHSVHSLIQALRLRPEYEVSWLCKGQGIETPEDARSAIAANDLIITQLNWAREITQISQDLGKPTFVFFRSYEGFCSIANDGFALSHCGQRCAPCQYRIAWNRLPNKIIANSEATRKLLKEQHGIESDVVYPFMQLERTEGMKASRTWILMNQLSYHKGADIFIRLAARFPDEQFRVVGQDGWMPKLEPVSNFQYLGVLEQKVFLSQARVVLFPSRIQDTFGRMIVEAGFTGVPVLAVGRGAAREDNLVPEQFLIEEVENLDEWEMKLRWVLDHYAKARDMMLSRDFRRFELQRNVEQFCALLSE